MSAPLARLHAALRPIEGWRRAWRLDTVRAAMLLALLSSLQTDALPLLRDALPVAWWPHITFGFAVAIAVLRLRAQPGALDRPADPPAGPSPAPPAPTNGAEKPEVAPPVNEQQGGR